MRSVKIALAAGLTLLAIGIGLTLLHSPMSVAHANGVPLEEDEIATTNKSATYCQAHELLPGGTSAIRISLNAFTGPRVRLVVTSGGQSITGGERGSGWTSRVVTVPVKPLPRTVSGVTVCVSFRLRDETISVFGRTTPRATAAHDGRQTLRGRIWIEYLRPGERSWASLVPSIARRMGLGRAAAGTWIVLLALALLAAVAVLASSLVLEELR
jgi:hypothetical protein